MKLLSALNSLFALTVLLSAPAARAQAIRTWVSSDGDDANLCSRKDPCRTFAGAISKTAAGGEITGLDSGAFGALTITKSITINGDGSLNSLTDGIVINAASSDDIAIRNLSINGAGNGISGIRFLAGKSLTVDNCTISGFTTRGIDVSLTNGGKVYVRDTRITRGATGIFVSSVNNQAQASLERVALTGLATGFQAGVNGKGTISNSVISGNSTNGILTSDATARINVASSQFSFNDGTAVNCNTSGAIIRVSNNDIYNNPTGIAIASGCTVESNGNNRQAGNTLSAVPNGTPIPLQ